jgi:hypothetical protein
MAKVSEVTYLGSPEELISRLMGDTQEVAAGTRNEWTGWAYTNSLCWLICKMGRKEAGDVAL